MKMFTYWITLRNLCVYLWIINVNRFYSQLTKIYHSLNLTEIIDFYIIKCSQNYDIFKTANMRRN
jgi:hypothetical protein